MHHPAIAPPATHPRSTGRITTAGEPRGAGALCPTPLTEPSKAVERLLAACATAHRAPWQVWAPWLMACMGLEPGEIAHLSPFDLERHHGRWFLQVHRGATGVLKGARQRALPVPSGLIEAGLIPFMHAQSGHVLFPELAGQPARRLNRWLRQRGASCGVRFDAETPVEWLQRSCSQALHASGMPMYFLHAFMGRTVSKALMKAMAAVAWGDPALLLVYIDRVAFPTVSFALAGTGRVHTETPLHYRKALPHRATHPSRRSSQGS